MTETRRASKDGARAVSWGCIPGRRVAEAASHNIQAERPSHPKLSKGLPLSQWLTGALIIAGLLCHQLRLIGGLVIDDAIAAAGTCHDDVAAPQLDAKLVLSCHALY